LSFIIDIALSSSRFHLLPHEAIIDELKEGNYEESIQYLKELFELEEIRRKADPLIWEKPRLKKNKNAMSRLRDGLIIVEQAKNAGEKENCTRNDLLKCLKI